MTYKTQRVFSKLSRFANSCALANDILISEYYAFILLFLRAHFFLAPRLYCDEEMSHMGPFSSHPFKDKLLLAHLRDLRHIPSGINIYTSSRKSERKKPTWFSFLWFYVHFTKYPKSTNIFLLQRKIEWMRPANFRF